MRSVVTFPSSCTGLFVTRGTQKLSEPEWTQLSIWLILFIDQGLPCGNWFPFS